jgi:dihydrofolate synthase/folylpolyglutamate synthase
VFETARPDVLVLEVGLGGRLDAVNVVDADVAVVVSVGLDHMEWLGPNTETIGREKAGIFRAGRPAVFGACDPPRSVREEAQRIAARLLVLGEDFDGRTVDDSRWDFMVHGDVRHSGLPRPALQGSIQVANAASALMTIDALGPRAAVGRAAIEFALLSVQLPGRFQRVDDARGFQWILDVAHNPAAAHTLATNLSATPVAGRTLAICGMLGDKDVAAVVAELQPVVDLWFAAQADGPRSITDLEIARRGAPAGVTLKPAGSVAEALHAAASLAKRGDRIVVFGSFHTVGPALVALGVPL